MHRVPAARRALLAKVSPAKGILWTIFAVAAATALRWVIDRGEAGAPLATYLPTVLLASLFLGWRYGTATAVLSGVAVDLFILPEHVLFYHGWRDAALTGLYGLSCAVLVFVADVVRRLVRELDDATNREILLNQELHHRMQNVIAVINALATMSARHSEPDAFLTAFRGRLRALSRATDLLKGGTLNRCEARELIDRAVSPFRSQGNIRVDGTDCHLPADACVPLVLAVHELCTNATKYGALSVPDGCVEVDWRFLSKEAHVLRVHWTESGGPPVIEPGRRGLGTRLLHAQKGLQEVRLSFRPAGVECEIVITGAEPIGDRMVEPNSLAETHADEFT